MQLCHLGSLGPVTYHPLQTEAVIPQDFAFNVHTQKGLRVRPVSNGGFATLCADTRHLRMQR